MNVSHRAASAVPAGHPGEVLLNPGDLYEYPYWEVELTSGRRPEGLRALRYWTATATVRDRSDGNRLFIPVADMSITVVNEFLGDPVWELDALDGDSMVLGTALWREKSERTEEFEDFTEGDWAPVAVVNSYEVAPDWRGTPLSPIIALRMLDLFAHLGLSAAALYPAPYNSDLPDEARDAASVKIAAMWERAGFTRLHPELAADTDGGRVMVRVLDSIEIANDLDALAGTDPVLRSVIEE